MRYFKDISVNICRHLIQTFFIGPFSLHSLEHTSAALEQMMNIGLRSDMKTNSQLHLFLSHSTCGVNITIYCTSSPLKVLVLTDDLKTSKLTTLLTSKHNASATTKDIEAS